MRTTLSKYLSIDGTKIGELANIVGRSRETVRKYRDEDFQTTVVFDPDSLAVNGFYVYQEKEVLVWERKNDS